MTIRFVRTVATVCVLVLSVASCAPGAGGTTANDANDAGVRALLAEEVAAVRANDMGRRYQLESAAYRQECDEADFATYTAPGGDWYGVTSQPGTGALLQEYWANVEVREVEVSVTGTTATVSFDIWTPGNSSKPVYRRTASYKAVYADGRWWKDDPAICL